LTGGTEIDGGGGGGSREVSSGWALTGSFGGSDRGEASGTGGAFFSSGTGQTTSIAW